MQRQQKNIQSKLRARKGFESNQTTDAEEIQCTKDSAFFGEVGDEDDDDDEVKDDVRLGRRSRFSVMKVSSRHTTITKYSDLNKLKRTLYL